MAKAKKKLLWVDDDIDKLSAYVAALREKGYKVFAAASTDDGVKIAENNQLDLVLADIQMPPPNGIEMLRRIHEVAPKVMLAVLSSFLYRQRYRDELASLGFAVQLMDKNLPNIYDESFESKFLHPIEQLLRKGITYTITESKNRTKSQGIDPFSIQFSQFMELPHSEKDYLLDRAEEMARSTIEMAFKRGCVWVLLCGDKGEIATSADDMNKIPAEDEILHYAQKLNRAPYQFLRGMTTEDHFWTECASDPNLRNYPTISLLFGGQELEIHFDTGCPFSLLSYEELVAMGVIRNVTQFVKEIRNGFPPYYLVILKNLDVIVRSQKSGQTVAIKLNCKAVREWGSTSYARFCKKSCVRRSDSGEDNLCPLRKGLMGRNILTDNRIALTLDGELNATYFRGE